MATNASKLRRQVRYILPAIRALIRIFIQHPDFGVERRNVPRGAGPGVNAA